MRNGRQQLATTLWLWRSCILTIDLRTHQDCLYKSIQEFFPLKKCAAESGNRRKKMLAFMMLIVHHESCLFLSSHVYSTTFHAFHQSEITRWQLWVARRWPKSRKDSTASPCAESHLEAFHGNLSQKTIHSIHEKHQTFHIFHQNHPLGLQIWNQIVSQWSPLARSCLCFCTMYYEHELILYVHICGS